MANPERFIPIDWYESTGRPRRYHDSEAHEDIGLREYRKRRAEMDEVVTDEDEPPTIADAEPPPPPRRNKTDQQVADEAQGSREKKSSGLAEALAPGIAAFVYTLTSLFWRNSPRLVFAPPPEVTTPMITPLTRIADRHLALALKLENTADGRDLIEMLGAMAGAGAWFMEALGAYEDAIQSAEPQGPVYYEPEPRPVRQQPPGSNGTAERARREAASAPVDTGGDWAAELVRRAGEPHGAANTQRDDGLISAADDTPDSGQYGAIAPSRASAALRQLYNLDSIGRRNRGLR